MYILHPSCQMLKKKLLLLSLELFRKMLPKIPQCSEEFSSYHHQNNSRYKLCWNYHVSIIAEKTLLPRLIIFPSKLDLRSSFAHCSLSQARVYENVTKLSFEPCTVTWWCFAFSSYTVLIQTRGHSFRERKENVWEPSFSCSTASFMNMVPVTFSS